MEPVEINAGSYYLRAMRADDQFDDRPAIVAGFSDPDTRRWAPNYRIDDLAAAGDYIERRAKEWAGDIRCSWAIADPVTGALLGEVGLKELDLEAGTAEAYCWTHPASRGRGAAAGCLGAALRFGFGALGLRRIVYQHAKGNLASRRVAEKCGFRLINDGERVVVLGDGTEDHVLKWLATPD